VVEDADLVNTGSVVEVAVTVVDASVATTVAEGVVEQSSTKWSYFAADTVATSAVVYSWQIKADTE